MPRQEKPQTPKRDIVHYWRDQELDAVEFSMFRRSGHIFPKHVHDDLYLVGCMDEGGSWCVEKGDDENLVGPGELCLISPGQVHSGIPHPNVPYVSFRMLYAGACWVRGLASEVRERDDGFPEFTTLVSRDPVLTRLMHRVLQLSLRTDCCAMEKETAALDAFARLLTRHCGVRAAVRHPGSENGAVRIAKEMLAADLAERISLDHVARAADLSRYHLLRVFKRATGLPPHAFRTQRRIDRAKELLKQGMPFADVALETGFTDQSHFTNKFKQFTGATPSHYLSDPQSGALAGRTVVVDMG